MFPQFGNVFINPERIDSVHFFPASEKCPFCCTVFVGADCVTLRDEDAQGMLNLVKRKPVGVVQKGPPPDEVL